MNALVTHSLCTFRRLIILVMSISASRHSTLSWSVEQVHGAVVLFPRGMENGSSRSECATNRGSVSRASNSKTRTTQNEEDKPRGRSFLVTCSNFYMNLTNIWCVSLDLYVWTFKLYTWEVQHYVGNIKGSAVLHFNAQQVSGIRQVHANANAPKLHASIMQILFFVD